jgi:hypothetical protein
VRLVVVRLRGRCSRALCLARGVRSVTIDHPVSYSKYISAGSVYRSDLVTLSTVLVPANGIFLTVALISRHLSLDGHWVER